MEDHPILGAVLFVIGAVLVASGHHAADAQSLVIGHIIAFNGVLLVILGCRSLERRADHFKTALHMRPAASPPSK
jgi:hypothetical protein